MARAALLERLITDLAPETPLPDPQVPAERESPDPTAPGGPRASVDWRTATVIETARETPRSTTLVLDVPGWPGHRAGQHVDVRLTAEDGYQAQRSYSIASAPEESVLRLTVDRLEDGEVSPFLVDDVLSGDELELRGPIGGPFTWSVDDGGPLLLFAGGSGVVPLMAMLRHRAAQGSAVPARLLHSVRAPREALFRRELLGLSGPSAVGPGTSSLEVAWTYTRLPPPGWEGFHGRVDAAMLDAFEAGGPAGPEAGAIGGPSPAGGAPPAFGDPAAVSTAGTPPVFGEPFASAGVPAIVAEAVATATAGAPPAFGAPLPTSTDGHPPDPAERVFVCGPSPFVETVASLLVDRGHDPARIRTERFGPS